MKKTSPIIIHTLNSVTDYLKVCIINSVYNYSRSKEILPDLNQQKKKATKFILAGVEKLPDGCWIWKRFADGNGYPIMRAFGKRMYAHRVIAILTDKTAMNSSDRIHRTCQNKLCVNPGHILVVKPLSKRLPLSAAC